MAKIFYFALADEMLKTDKLNWFQETPLSKIDFKSIKPDAKSNWINQTDNDFDELLPLIEKETKGKERECIFELNSLGVASHRDSWVYDYTKLDLAKKIQFFTGIYNKTVQNEAFEEKDKISWDRELSNYARRKIFKSYESEKNIKANFRPFVCKNFYYDKHFNGMLYQFQNIFKTDKIENNLLLSINRGGNNKGFFLLASNKIVDLHFTGDSQCLPLSIYNKNGERKDNITDWALAEFQNHYNNKNITKENIFYYVYAVLHTPQYRVKYEQNLKREFPRIPYYKDFMFFVERGKQLADLHIGYEKVQPYPLEIEVISKNKPKAAEPMLFEEPITDLYGKAQRTQYVPKAKLKAHKDTGEIEIDDITILRGIPAEAWTYKLGNRSALEWILDQYKESKPSDKTIAEHFNTYRFADYKEEVMQLLKRVCRVSVETVRIVRELEHAKS